MKESEGMSYRTCMYKSDTDNSVVMARGKGEQALGGGGQRGQNWGHL